MPQKKIPESKLQPISNSAVLTRYSLAWLQLAVAEEFFCSLYERDTSARWPWRPNAT